LRWSRERHGCGVEMAESIFARMSRTARLQSHGRRTSSCCASPAATPLPPRRASSHRWWSGVASARRALATSALLDCTPVARSSAGLKARRSTNSRGDGTAGEIPAYPLVNAATTRCAQGSARPVHQHDTACTGQCTRGHQHDTSCTGQCAPVHRSRHAVPSLRAPAHRPRHAVPRLCAPRTGHDTPRRPAGGLSSSLSPWSPPFVTQRCHS
jgi:hypothetical protein